MRNYNNIKLIYWAHQSPKHCIQYYRLPPTPLMVLPKGSHDGPPQRKSWRSSPKEVMNCSLIRHSIIWWIWLVSQRTISATRNKVTNFLWRPTFGRGSHQLIETLQERRKLCRIGQPPRCKGLATGRVKNTPPHQSTGSGLINQDELFKEMQQKCQV